MSKKQMIRRYLLDNVDLFALKRDYHDSWLIKKPFNWLYNSGIVSTHFNYTLMKKAIEYAGYKYPDSDRTWLTAIEARNEIIEENYYFLRY